MVVTAVSAGAAGWVVVAGGVMAMGASVLLAGAVSVGAVAVGAAVVAGRVDVISAAGGEAAWRQAANAS